MNLSGAVLKIPLPDFHFVCAYPGQIVFFRSESYVSNFSESDYITISYFEFDEFSEFCENSIKKIKKKHKETYSIQLNLNLKLEFSQGKLIKFIKEDGYNISFNADEDIFFEFFMSLTFALPCVIYPSQREIELLNFIKCMKKEDFRKVSESVDSWQAIQSKTIYPESWYFVQTHKNLINLLFVCQSVSK